MEEEQVKNCGPRDHEWEQEVEREKPSQRRIIYRETPSDSLYQRTPDVGDGGQ